ncbi:MAG: alpha-glucosidase/alpha-galactosidase [Thermomicrobia bacterium]|nr:alpha-glucosidase/alpha-galactosidase [Thermomicrobia bacterium]MCA1723711.1 alpha-glucosidase/alpha-galactosidase [Thermomicrobia bacterium]
MTALRIGVIGAGSAVFSLGLVKDLCLTPSLAGSEVIFMDINAERLHAVTGLARRYAAEMGASLRFVETMERRDALADADFVINTAFAKGHHHARQVREITAEHGYYYGGVHLGGFDDLRLMMDVARDMERICPDAWLIQSGNPVYEGCTLMTRETGLKIIGLCHGHYHYLDICEVLGLDPARVTFQAPGLNHQIWMTHFLFDGEDAYPRLDAWIATEAEAFWRSHTATRTHDIQMSRGAIQQYQLYGLMPIGDTVRSRHNWWQHTDIETKKYYFGEPWGGPDTELARPFYVANHEKKMAEAARIARDPSARVADFIGTTRTREQQVPIIDALVNNHGAFFQVNVPNNGALAGVADDVVVEVPAWIDRAGIFPLRVTPLPRKIMLEHILPRVLEMERDLEAFTSGDRTMLLWNVVNSPQTRSFGQAAAALDDLLAMEENAALAAHYAGPRIVGEQAAAVPRRATARSAD